MSDKKFGLIIPKKTDKIKIQTSSVFGDESDEDEKQSNRPKIPQKQVHLKSKIKQEALEDPSIYEYDSIYDEMKAKEAESIAPKEKKNSRYIETLLKAADKRKKEYERRIDKKIQAERENEGDKYKDKEAFVTSSYKKKLQEKEEEEERERRENMLNDMMDVTKQKDLSGFYRHFLKQTVGEEKVPEFDAKNIKKEPCEEGSDEEARKLDLGNIDQDSDGIEIDSESDESDSKYKISLGTENIPRKDDDSNGKNRKSKSIRNDDSNDRSKYLPQKKKHKTHHKRTNSTSSLDSLSSNNEDIVPIEKNPHSSRKSKSYRSKHESSSDSDHKSYQNEKQKEHFKKNKYKVSSADAKQSNVENLKPHKNTNYSSSSDSETEPIRDSCKKSSDSNKKTPKIHSRHDSSSDDDVDDSKEKESQKQTEKDENAKKKKVKKNIYTKRTVGEIFISAQARYFQRMALKT